MANDAELEALVAAIRGTGKSLEDTELIYTRLREEQERSDATVRKMRVVLWTAVVGLILDLMLSLSFGIILHNQVGLNARVTANQMSLHDAECGINTLFIAFDTPEQRATVPNVKMYDSFYDGIYKTRIDLGCAPPIAKPNRPNK